MRNDVMDRTVHVFFLSSAEAHIGVASRVVLHIEPSRSRSTHWSPRIRAEPHALLKLSKRDLADHRGCGRR